MTEKRFNDLYLDKSFREYVGKIIKSIYRSNEQTFSDNSVDFDDFEQECFMALFDRVDDDKDSHYCALAIRSAAIDFLRTMTEELKFVDDGDADLEKVYASVSG